MKTMNTALAISAALLAVTQGYSSDWNFYGSVRAGTFGQSVVDTGSNGTTTNSKSYSLQGNSRFGAKVAPDSTISGQVEYGVKSVLTSAAGATASVPSLRLLYGTWKINNDVSLQLGQNWSIIDFEKSNQVFNADNDLESEGAITELRVQQVRLTAYGFKLAFVPGSQTAITATKTLSYATRPDNLPKVEAAYDYPIGPAHIGIAAAYNGYTLDRQNPISGGYKNNYDVSNYLGVLDFGVKTNVVNFNASAGYVVNGTEFGLTTTNPYKAAVDSTGKLVDATSFLGYADVNAPLGMVVPEAGVGVEAHSQDMYGKTSSDTRITAYLQAGITPVKHFSFTPEVGVIVESLKPAGGSSYDKPTTYYYGAKTQIDF
jgi:hypothetical protein